MTVSEGVRLLGAGLALGMLIETVAVLAPHPLAALSPLLAAGAALALLLWVCGPEGDR